MKQLIIGFIFMLLSSYGYCQIAFFGPMLHYNFGKGDRGLSVGVEASIWNTDFGYLPQSIDIGIEFEKKKMRLYGEFQYYILYSGISFGYVKEFTKNEKSFGGFQASLWSAFFLGLDMRYRRLNKKNYLAPGIFFKLPLGSNLDFNL